jgi:formylglycine-generating enzyme required for sulfatase activity
MRLVAAFACAVMLMAFGTLPSHAEKRVALVIGNGAYRNAPPLPNPRNDAEDVSAALKRVGFETIVALNLDKKGMDDATIRFARAAHDADVAIFYYSGHAMQFAGSNYLIPVDAKLVDEADLRRMTRVDEIVADLQQARNLRILVLDSCRDNPLADELKRSIGLTRAASMQRGLARIDTPYGMIVAYSTQSGQTAEDGIGRNSPYTAAFLSHIEAREEVGTIFRHVTADVYEATGRRQLPELSLSLIGEFYLRERPQTQTVEAAQAWAAVKDTMSLAVLEDFISRYGGTLYGTLARARLEEVKKIQASLPTQPTTSVQPSGQEGSSVVSGLLNWFSKPATAPASTAPSTTVATVAPPMIPAQQPATSPKPAVIAPPVQPVSPCKSDATIVSLSVRPAGPLSSVEECTLKPKDVFKECDKCPEMVVVAAGSFTMGSRASEAGHNADEGPQHSVTIPKLFAVGKFHVTVDQFAAFVAESGYNDEQRYWGHVYLDCLTFEGEVTSRERSWRSPGFAQTGSHPAVCVNWDTARAYVAWLSRKTGRSYRLLTEAEWEYAARAGTSTRYFFGDNDKDFCRYGNGADQSAIKSVGFDKGGKIPCSDGYAYTAPVGAFRPNAFGLYDVHGNAWQWLEDCWHESYTGAPADGSAWTWGDCGWRVLRGGNWFSDPRYLRSASRISFPTYYWRNGAGVRVGRTLGP